jgi:hypothetical protein
MDSDSEGLGEEVEMGPIETIGYSQRAVERNREAGEQLVNKFLHSNIVGLQKEAIVLRATGLPFLKISSVPKIP